MVISGYVFGHRLTLAPLRCLVMSECVVIGVSPLNLTTSQREKILNRTFPFQVSFSHLCKILEQKIMACDQRLGAWVKPELGRVRQNY
jgi:hypothetical protein